MLFAQNKNKNQLVHNTEKTEKITSLTDKGILVLKANSQERMEAYNPSVSVLSLKHYRKKIQKCGSFPVFFSSSSCWLSEEGNSVTEEVLMSCGQTVKGDSHTEGQELKGQCEIFIKGVPENGFPFLHLPRESMLILAVLCVFHFRLLHPRNVKTPWNWFRVECYTKLGFPISHLIQSSLGLSLTPPSGPSPGGQPKRSNLHSIYGGGSQC